MRRRVCGGHQLGLLVKNMTQLMCYNAIPDLWLSDLVQGIVGRKMKKANANLDFDLPLLYAYAQDVWRGTQPG